MVYEYGFVELDDAMADEAFFKKKTPVTFASWVGNGTVGP